MKRNKHSDEVKKGFLAPVGGGVQNGLRALPSSPSSCCFYSQVVSLTDLLCYLENQFFLLLETAEESPCFKTHLCP